MGTNYYLYDGPPCEKCGRLGEALHIGKSSAGWCFSLHVIPEEGINDLDDWIERWNRPGAYIQNEYGDSVSPEEMERKITRRGRRIGCDPWSEADYDANHAEPGPNGLARHKISRWCVGHGAGTWDLITGEFS